MNPRDPLAAGVYLRRCPQRILPAWLVMMLVTVLLLALLTPTNTFRETSEANMAALDAMTVVGPAQGWLLDPALVESLALNPDIERCLSARASWVRYPMLVGEAFCAMLLVEQVEIPELLRRTGVELQSGTLPRADSSEIVIHEDVASARGLSIGDRFGNLVDPDDATPGAYRVVGMLRGRARIAVGALGGAGTFESALGRAASFQVLYPRPGRKAAMDQFLHAARNGTGPAFQVIDAAFMRRRIEQALRNLPLLTALIGVASASVVGLVVTLLQLIVFHGRSDEFAILLVMGLEPRRLIRKLASECGLMALSAWLAGVVVGILVLALYQQAVFAPRGLLVRIVDVQPILVSSLVPLASVAASLLALQRRLRGMDPVSVIQRRGAA